LVDDALKRAVVGQASAEKVISKPTSNQNPKFIMTKHILLLAAVLGFIAQSSVFAADPTPAPSASASASASAPSKKTHHHATKKHHKKAAEPAASPTATP
jgi:hypothetical protein